MEGEGEDGKKRGDTGKEWRIEGEVGWGNESRIGITNNS